MDRIHCSHDLTCSTPSELLQSFQALIPQVAPAVTHLKVFQTLGDICQKRKQKIEGEKRWICRMKLLKRSSKNFDVSNTGRSPAKKQRAKASPKGLNVK